MQKTLQTLDSILIALLNHSPVIQPAVRTDSPQFKKTNWQPLLIHNLLENSKEINNDIIFSADSPKECVHAPEQK